MKHTQMDNDGSKQKTTNRNACSDDECLPEPNGFRRSILHGNGAYGFLRNYYGYFLPGISLVLYAILYFTQA